MKATKTILTFAIVVLALIQAPFIYYYGDGMFGFLATIPYLLIGFALTIVLIRLTAKHKESTSTMHYIGLGVAVTLGLVSLYPNGQYFESLDWKYRLKERNRIVEGVKQGKLKPNVKHNNMICKLPTNYVPEISDGGNEIAIFKETNSLAVEFYIYRGYLITTPRLDTLMI